MIDHLARLTSMIVIMFLTGATVTWGYVYLLNMGLAFAISLHGGLAL